MSKDSYYWRVWVIVFAGVMTVFAAAQLVVEYNQLVVEKYASNEDSKSDSLEIIERAAEQAKSFYPFAGGMDDVYLTWLEYKRFYENDKEDANEASRLLRHKELSIVSKRSDGLSWASLAENMAFYGQKDFDFHYSLLSAGLYGLFEYDTARSILRVAVREWPILNCEEKRMVASIVDYGEKVNDNIIFYRNLSAGMSPFQEYLDELTDRYNFDRNWARIEAEKCQARG